MANIVDVSGTAQTSCPADHLDVALRDSPPVSVSPPVSPGRGGAHHHRRAHMEGAQAFGSRRLPPVMARFPAGPVLQAEDVPPEVARKVATELSKKKSRVFPVKADTADASADSPLEPRHRDATPDASVISSDKPPRARRRPAGLPSVFRRLYDRVDSTPAMVAARVQPTPFRTNRFVLLIVYLVYALLTGRVYFAWPNISNMLFRSGAYVWVCGDLGAPGFVDLRADENGGWRFACEAQNTEVQKLFVVCLACAFACALLAGVFLDKLGPKLTALFGQACSFTAWMLLGFAGQQFPSYYPAFIILGVGADSGYMPVLSIANLFPGHEGLVVALLGSAKSLSFAMPTILDAVEGSSASVTVKDVCIGYAALGPGLCFLVALFLIDCNPFLPWTSFTRIEEAMDELARRQDRRWSSVFRSSSVSSLFSGRHDKGGGTASSTDVGEARTQCDTGQSYCSSERPSSSPEPLPTLRQQLRSKYCILMVVHSIIQALLYPFVSTSAEGLFGRDVNNFLGIGLPFSCISCVVYGKLTDMYGIMKVLLGINTLMVAVYGLALFKSTFASYLAAFLLILYVGFYSSQVYCYVSDTFGTKQFGRIVGTIFMIAGFCSLLKIPLQSMVVDVFDSVYTWPVVIMIGLCCFNYVVLGVLYYFKRKMPHPFWPKEATADAEARAEKKHRAKEDNLTSGDRLQGGRDVEIAAQATGVPLTERSVSSDVAVDVGLVSTSREAGHNLMGPQEDTTDVW